MRYRPEVSVARLRVKYILLPLAPHSPILGSLWRGIHFHGFDSLCGAGLGRLTSIMTSCNGMYVIQGHV